VPYSLDLGRTAGTSKQLPARLYRRRPRCAFGDGGVGPPRRRLLSSATSRAAASRAWAKADTGSRVLRLLPPPPASCLRRRGGGSRLRRPHVSRPHGPRRWTPKACRLPGV